MPDAASSATNWKCGKKPRKRSSDEDSSWLIQDSFGCTIFQGHRMEKRELRIGVAKKDNNKPLLQAAVNH